MEKFRRLKWGCYISNVCMSIVSCFIPLLFVPFHDMYGISYTELGSLVFVNFSTQLVVDLIYTIFSKRLNVKTSILLMPYITLVGLLFLSVVPFIFVNFIYPGLVIGVIIISASSGIAEVLISRVISAIPSDNPQGEMSKLHSTFAFGVVGAVLFCTLWLRIFGYGNWTVLSIVLSLIPLCAIILLFKQPFPTIITENSKADTKPLFSFTFFLCVLCIFLGASCENVMSQWISSYVEKGLGIKKIYGDIFGVALFSLFLGFGRFLYAKKGKNITKVLITSASATFVLYILSVVVSVPGVAVVFCALCGFTTAMLWPGTIIASSPEFEKTGVAMFALLAAGGDFGASISPQIMGWLTDLFINGDYIVSYAQSVNISVEVVAMKTALLCMAIFPLLLIIVTLIIHFRLKK